MTTPAGSMTQPEGWVVTTFDVQGGDWSIRRSVEWKSEHIARQMADLFCAFMREGGAPQTRAVFVGRSGSNTWETVGTKYDVERVAVCVPSN